MPFDLNSQNSYEIMFSEVTHELEHRVFLAREVESDEPFPDRESTFPCTMILDPACVPYGD